MKRTWPNCWRTRRNSQLQVVPILAWPAEDGTGAFVLGADSRLGWDRLAMLHEWGTHEHPTLMSPDQAKPGNGLLIFFRVDNFEIALANARTLVSRLEEEPHTNPATGTLEFALRDPEGYYVMVSAWQAV